MGKEGELWDDSALINAFDHALSNYKKVHGKAQPDSSKAGEQETSGSLEDLSTCVDEKNDTKRQATEDSNNDAESNSKPNLQETSNELPTKEDQQEPNWNSSSVYGEQNAHQSYPNTQGADDYNQLLNRYYEIEEQRQKIIQQLDPYNYWNLQQSGHNQQYPVTPGQINHLPYNSTLNQCMVAPCYLGGTCTSETSGIKCYGQSTFVEDSNVTKAALAAAEKAISSLKIENTEKQKEACAGLLEASATGETDLNAVFNAWYTAGFYTGKYLAEHSIAKKRQG